MATFAKKFDEMGVERLHRPKNRLFLSWTMPHNFGVHVEALVVDLPCNMRLWSLLEHVVEKSADDDDRWEYEPGVERWFCWRCGFCCLFGGQKRIHLCIEMLSATSSARMAVGVPLQLEGGATRGADPCHRHGGPQHSSWNRSGVEAACDAAREKFVRAHAAARKRCAAGPAISACDEGGRRFFFGIEERLDLDVLLSVRVPISTHLEVQRLTPTLSFNLEPDGGNLVEEKAGGPCFCTVLQTPPSTFNGSSREDSWRSCHGDDAQTLRRTLSVSDCRRESQRRTDATWSPFRSISRC